MSQNFPRHELFLFRFFPQPFKNLKTILSWQEKQAVAGLGSLGVACTPTRVAGHPPMPCSQGYCVFPGVCLQNRALGDPRQLFP